VTNTLYVLTCTSEDAHTLTSIILSPHLPMCLQKLWH